MPFPSYAYALRGLGHWHWLVSSGIVSFVLLEQLFLFSVTVVFVIEPVSFFTEPAFFISYKKPKKTACGLLYITCVFIKLLYILCFAEFWSCVSRKNYFDILCIAEKSKMSLIFRKQKCPLNGQICPLGYLFTKSIFLEVIKIVIPIKSLTFF